MQKSLSANVLYKLLLNGFNLIFPLLLGPYIYRTLGVSSIGLVQYAESIFNFFFVIGSFGIYRYGLREMSRIRGDRQKLRRLFSSLLTISAWTSSIGFVLFLLVCIAGYRDQALFPVLLIYSVHFLANIFYVEWVNEALEKYKFIAIKTMIIRGIYALLLFMLIHGSGDHLLYTILLVGFMLINNVVSFLYIRRSIGLSFSNLDIRMHLKPMLAVVLYANAGLLYTQLDRVMIGHYAGARHVSYYVLAQQVMTIVFTLILSVVQATTSRLAYLAAETDQRAYIQLLNKISKVYLAFLFPIGIGMYISSDSAVVLYGGAQFSRSGPLLALFAIYMIVIGVEHILSSQIIYPKQKESMLIRLFAVGGGLNLVFNLLLVFGGRFTTSSAIASTTLAMLVVIGLEYRYIRRTLQIGYRLFDYHKFKYLGYALLFIPLSAVIRHYVERHWLLLCLQISANSLLYLLILIVSKDEVLRMLLHKIKPPKAAAGVRK